MESTFQKFIENNPVQKAAFEKEYDAFMLSELMLEQMQNKNLSPKELAKKARVSPALIKKISKSETSGKVKVKTLQAVAAALGCRLTLQSR